MRVSTYIVVLLITCCLGGLGLLAGFSYFNSEVESARDRVTEYELTQKELSRFTDSIGQWFLFSDLILGNDQSHLSAGERDLRRRVDDQMDSLRRSRFGRDARWHVLEIVQFVDRHKLRLAASMTLNGDGRSDRLRAMQDEFDRESEPVVSTLDLMDEALDARIAAAHADHVATLGLRAFATWLMAILFVSSIMLFWRWISRTISNPLQSLSSEARQASLEGTLIQKVRSGPAEIVNLSASFSNLVGCMDARVRERTQHLADANRELNIARLQAEAASEAKSDFLTNVSHELRTPLASIRASAEILNNYPDESKEVRLEFAEVIQLEAERLSRLIDNVLDLGKIESGRSDWKVQKVQVADTLFEVVRAANVDKDGSGVTVTLDVQGELPRTLADRDRLLQLWTNLVGNAVKFTRKGGEVAVVASMRGDSIVVEVRDQGPGIREDDQKVIFERFSQVTDDTLTDKPHGTGLGLAIAKEIADHHDATIQVESEWGVGTIFRVVLPLLREEAVAALPV